MNIDIRKKRNGLVALTFSLALVFVFVSSAVLAQVRSRKQPIQTLEYSLKSLYESAAEVAKKNKWLKAEIQKMKQQTTFLREELHTLDSTETKKNFSDILQDKEIMQDAPWEEERLNMLFEDYIELDEEEKYLKERLEGKKNDQENIEADVRRLSKEVAVLKKSKKTLEKRLEDKPDKQEIRRLKDILSRSERNLKYALKKYNRLARKFGRPLKEFSQIKDNNIELKGRAAYLQRQLQRLEQEGARIREDIGQLRSGDTRKLAVLNEEIDALKDERIELKQVLQQAEKKLGKEFAVPDYEPQVRAVQYNIETIKKENEQLKKELISLEKRIEQRQTK